MVAMPACTGDVTKSLTSVDGKETISMHVNCDNKAIRYVKPYPCMLTVIIK